MPRVLPGLEVERWLAEEPNGPRRSAVVAWLVSLVEGGLPVTLTNLPAAEPSIDVEIPNTDLVATCIVISALDAIVIERIVPA